MRVIVVHEDGDKGTRVAILAQEIKEAIAAGTMRYQAVMVEQQIEVVCTECGETHRPEVRCHWRPYRPMYAEKRCVCCHRYRGEHIYAGDLTAALDGGDVSGLSDNRMMRCPGYSSGVTFRPVPDAR